MAGANSMSAQRFLFDTSFDPEEIERRAEEARAAAEAARAERQEPDPPPAPTFSEAELEAARQDAFAAGFEAGRSEAMTSVESSLAAALAAVMERIGDLAEAQRASDAELAGHMIDAALALVRKMLPALMRREGAAEIEAVVRACLADTLEEPRIVIRVSDAMLDPMRQRMTDAARAGGYQGAVVLLADPALGPGDVKVEWADGGAERISDRLWASIEEAAARLKADAATSPSASPKRRRKPAATAEATPTEAS